MIIRLNGTHGSGKSTVAKRLLRKYPHTKVEEGGKVVGYRVNLGAKTLHIIGPYETACGGCDAIQPYARIWPMVEAAADDFHVDHVFFEGALVSSSYGNIGRASEVYGDDWVNAFLDTPVEECIRRVNERRAQRGAEPIANTHNIEDKWIGVDRMRQKLERGEIEGANQRLAIISHLTPVKDVLALMGIRINKEPT